MTNPEESVPSPRKSTVLLTLTLLGPQGALRREGDQEETSAASVFTSKHTGQGLVAHMCHSSTWATRQEASLGYKTSNKQAKANNKPSLHYREGGGVLGVTTIPALTVFPTAWCVHLTAHLLSS